MIKTLLSAMTAALGAMSAALGALPAVAAVALDARVMQSGHSLTDPIPPLLIRMLQDMGVRDPVMDLSSIPGSTMDWRWANEGGEKGKDARQNIANYDVLVLTERAPLSNTLPFHNSEKEGARWARHAWAKGNGGKGAWTVLYGTWVHVNSGPGREDPYGDPDAGLTFLERLPREMAGWEQIADRMNAKLPKDAPRVAVIPGPLVMKAMAEAVADGAAPGITSIDALFGDEIHVNDTGAYLMALAHYAVIYGRDPRELPDRIGRHGQAELAAFMQDLVARVVDDYPRARPQPE